MEFGMSVANDDDCLPAAAAATPYYLALGLRLGGAYWGGLHPRRKCQHTVF